MATATLKLVETEPPHPTDKPKAIYIAGELCGEVKRSNITGGDHAWHSAIRLTAAGKDYQSILFQGFGRTAIAAVMNAIVRGRAERDAMSEKLAWLETQLTDESPADAGA